MNQQSVPRTEVKKYNFEGIQFRLAKDRIITTVLT